MVLEPVFMVISKGMQTMKLLSQELFSVSKSRTGSRRDHRMRPYQGFTVVELVVVMTIVAVLAFLTLPNLSEWQANSKVKSTSRDIVSHLQRAKMEAAKRNETIVVSYTSGAYSPGGAVGSYQVFVDDGGRPGPGGEADGVDNDQDGNTDEADEDRFSAGGIEDDFIRNGSEQFVLQQQSMPPGISLYTADFDGSATPGLPAKTSGFSPRGLPLSSADGTANAGLSIRNNKSRYYRILISPVGNIRLQVSDDGTTWK